MNTKSCVRFLTEELKVEGKTIVDVVMIEDIMSLDKVIVIGYGTARKSDLTGVVSSISSADIEKQASTDITQVSSSGIACVSLEQWRQYDGDSPLSDEELWFSRNKLNEIELANYLNGQTIDMEFAVQWLLIGKYA